MSSSTYDDRVAYHILYHYHGRLQFNDLVHIFSCSLKLGRTDIWRQALYMSRWFTLSEDKQLKDYDLSKYGLDVNALRKLVRFLPVKVVCRIPAAEYTDSALDTQRKYHRLSDKYGPDYE